MSRPSMTPVQSSNISQVGYDPATSELYITFHSGRTYKYENVPPGEFEMMQRGSVGSYFAANIKDQYKTVPV